MLLELVSLAAVLVPWAMADQPSAAPYAAPAPVPAAAPTQEVAEYPDGSYFQYTPYGYLPQTPEQSGLSIQSGYEGILVPEPQGHSVDLGMLALLKLVGWKLFPKLAPFAGGLLLLLLLGGAFTTAVCTLTPLCSLTFPFGRQTTNSVRGYLTPDRLTQTTAFVLDAIDKYKDLTQKVSAQEARNRDRKRR